jgi:hypothetical protein
LDITELGCDECGTGLTGRFRPCEFCGLDDTDRRTLRVFLASRGNMKELQAHLGVSYPTARARFDELLGRLGLAGDGPVTPSPPPADERLATLEALARGEVSVEDARARLDTREAT